MSYRGTVAVDRLGRKCMNWTDVPAERLNERETVEMVRGRPGSPLNRCRNPTALYTGPYCFVFDATMTSPRLRWSRQPCAVPYCRESRDVARHPPPPESCTVNVTDILSLGVAYSSPTQVTLQPHVVVYVWYRSCLRRSLYFINISFKPVIPCDLDNKQSDQSLFIGNKPSHGVLAATATSALM